MRRLALSSASRLRPTRGCHISTPWRKTTYGILRSLECCLAAPRDGHAHKLPSLEGSMNRENFALAPSQPAPSAPKRRMLPDGNVAVWFESRFD